MVGSLISPNYQWRLDLVNDLFPQEDVGRVLEMFPSCLKDKLIWAFTDHGSYSVKSGYWFVANHSTLPAAPVNAQNSYRAKLKSRVWKIKTAPKIRMFLWRVLSGAIAVAKRLSSRGLAVDPICKLCNVEMESINHVLFRCTVAQEAWSLTTIPLSLMGFGNLLEENMEFLFDIMESSSSPQVSGVIPWLLWNIWKHRNAIVYANTQHTVPSLVNGAMEEATIWFAINNEVDDSSRANQSGGLQELHWQRPCTNIVKCNVHGNWRNAYLHSGGSWIARDHRGSVLFHAREAFTKSRNRITAELRCIIWALQSLRDMHFQDVSLAFDCSATYDAIMKPLEWPRYRAFTEAVLRLKASFRSCSFELESQSANKTAREIAKSVTRDGRFNSYMAAGGPSWLHDLIIQEASV